MTTTPDTPDTLAKLAADNLPERIYLVLGEDIAPDDDPRADFDDLADVTWCIDKQFDNDVEYVRADVAALTAQALPADGRGTDAQIEKERDIARHAIVGALAAGHAGQDHPGADHWLAAAHDAGVKIRAMEAAAAALQALPAAEPEIWPIVNIDVDEAGAITNAKLYAPGLPAGNHDVYPVRVPYMDEHTEAWQACADGSAPPPPNTQDRAMQSDRELIELAAKAAGYIRMEYREEVPYVSVNWNGDDFVAWNPLTDDGDALRLAVKLAIDVLHRFVGGRRTEALAPGGPVIAEWHEVHGGDADAATRRAITRAAAQLAQAQEGK